MDIERWGVLVRLGKAQEVPWADHEILSVLLGQVLHDSCRWGMTEATRKRSEERRGRSTETDTVRVAMKTRIELAPLIPAGAPGRLDQETKENCLQEGS